MTNASYRKLTAWLLAGWFVSVFAASALHVFKNGGGPAPVVGAAAATPVLLFLLWYAGSAGFREFVLGLNPRTLTLLHAWRTAGYTFLVLYTYGILPGVFALPAGWGDMAIGVTAPLVAFKLADPRHRASFILWQALGVADLVIAVTTGTTARLLDPHGISTAPMSVLPLSLIPTFAVPLLLILHVIAIAQARRWPKQEQAGVAGEVRQAAA